MDEELNRNQQKALQALMRTPTVAAAARRCGLSERTLWRYLGDSEFKAALDARQDRQTTALAAALGGLSDEAITALKGLLTGGDTPPSVTARVALGVLKMRRDVLELDELAQRVAALEESLGRR